MKFVSGDLGRRLLAMALVHVTKLGLEAAEKIIPLIISSFLPDLGVTEKELKCVSLVCPSLATLKNIMTDEAVDTILMEREDMCGILRP